MGNENSQPEGLEINKKAIQVTDYYNLYNGEIINESNKLNVSIFEESPTPLPFDDTNNKTALFKCIENLKIYRHPNILKYAASWTKGKLKYLATERCTPLSQVLSQQNDYQICLGIKDILSALVFLTEKANLRHLNVCLSSIYVNEKGYWRLGGLEHLWKKNEVTANHLQKFHKHRYIKSIDPDELKNQGAGIEQFAFAILCDEILINKTNTISSALEFRKYCNTAYKEAKASARPALSSLLSNIYFNHDFIEIHTFLFELPLQNYDNKQTFFTNIIERLRNFDEVIVAQQLCSLLLSRLVFIDATAQQFVLPVILKPRMDGDTVLGLFSLDIFKEFVIPQLIKIFCVHDEQIRLILLKYFSHYILFFTKEDLKNQILPQLLLGIKDSNDNLVAKTLLCLAELVPILGANDVIGGSRTKIFSDGRPYATSKFIEARSITPIITSNQILMSSSISENGNLSIIGNSRMPERLSPDGGEDLTESIDGEIEIDEWSDWDRDNDDNIVLTKDDENANIQSGMFLEDGGNFLTTNNTVLTESDILLPPSSIDIKQSKTNSSTIVNNNNNSDESESFNFFKDMEPQIQKANVLFIPDNQIENNLSPPTLLSTTATTTDKIEADITINSYKFDIKLDSHNDGEIATGWGDEDPEEGTDWD